MGKDGRDAKEKKQEKITFDVLSHRRWVLGTMCGMSLCVCECVSCVSMGVCV